MLASRRTLSRLTSFGRGLRHRDTADVVNPHELDPHPALIHTSGRRQRAQLLSRGEPRHRGSRHTGPMPIHAIVVVGAAVDSPQSASHARIMPTSMAWFCRTSAAAACTGSPVSRPAPADTAPEPEHGAASCRHRSRRRIARRGLLCLLSGTVDDAPACTAAPPANPSAPTAPAMRNPRRDEDGRVTAGHPRRRLLHSRRRPRHSIR